MDLTIEGKAYLHGAFDQCCIGISDGKIAAVKKILKGDEHVDFGSRLILPAGVDLHVHFRDPGFVHKEDFTTGSTAAAFGGVSCVFDMPNTRPQTIDTRSLVEKKTIAEKKSVVDFGLYTGVTENNIETIKDLAEHCQGFKIYLGSSTNSLHLSEQKLEDALKEIHASAKPVLIHAESNRCLDQFKIVCNNLRDHLRSRPAGCEETAIKNIVQLSKKIPSQTHICHLTSCDGMEMLKTKPQNITVGVTPHHLLFDVNKIKAREALYKVNPPIRTNVDRETLWRGVRTGMIDIIESDHAPHTLEEKDREFDGAPSGMPGVETMYPLFLAEVKQERLSFNRLMSLVCEKPAELLNVPKGKIEVGRDADLVVVDFKKISKINADELHSKCGWTAFEGMHAIFPTHVFVRGGKIIDDQEMRGRAGFGRCVGE